MMREVTAGKIFFTSCVFFLGGIGVGSLWNIGQAFALAVLFGGIFCIVFSWKNKGVVLVGFCIVFLAFGIFRYEKVEERLWESELVTLNDSRKPVEFLGKIAKEPKQQEQGVQLLVQPESIKGKILVTTDKFSHLEYGDVVRVQGILQEPPSFEDFDYREYAARQGIYSTMYHPSLEVVLQKDYKGISEKVQGYFLRLKQEFRKTIYRFVPLPEAAVLEGMLLGDEGNMSDELKEQFNKTGTRHIIAISGAHVLILTMLMMYVLLAVGLWRYQAFYCTLAFVILYVLFTGAEPSAVRAGIMGGLLLLSEHIGRLHVSLRALVFAGALMLFLSPLTIKDVGFQLSFFAVLGLIYGVPFFNHALRKVPNTFHIREVLSMTIAAQVFTFPILVSNFNQISLVSIVANVLIVPVSALLLVFGFLFTVFGMLGEWIGFLLSLPVILLLTYTTTLVDFFSKVPLSSIPVGHISFVWLAIFYFPVVFMLWKFQKRQEFPYS